MKIYKFAAAFVLAMGIWNFCLADSPPPLPVDAEKALRKQIDSDSQAQIKLVSFKKTDGLMSTVNAVQYYELDYETEIEFQTDGTWFKGMQGVSFGFSTQQANPGSMAAFANQTVNGGITVHRSDRVKISGNMQFIKKESGWVIVSGDCQVVSGPTASAPSVDTTSTTTGNDTTSKLLEKWKDKAEAGNANAEDQMGEIYYSIANYVEAVKWAREAAEQGNAGAENLLGLEFQLGQGVQQDNVEAVKWFRKSAEAGSPAGEADLANMLTNNLTEAAYWYRKSAVAGYSYGQSSLAYAYKDGLGVETNHVEAAKWFQKAADQGDDDAMFQLGRMYWSGDGVVMNHDTALDYYRDAVKAGNKNAKDELSKIQKIDR